MKFPCTTKHRFESGAREACIGLNLGKRVIKSYDWPLNNDYYLILARCETRKNFVCIDNFSSVTCLPVYRNVGNDERYKYNSPKEATERNLATTSWIETNPNFVLDGLRPPLQTCIITLLFSCKITFPKTIYFYPSHLCWDFQGPRLSLPKVRPATKQSCNHIKRLLTLIATKVAPFGGDLHPIRIPARVLADVMWVEINNPRTFLR